MAWAKAVKIAFFVRGVRPRDLDRAEFYRQDFRALTELGHTVYWAGSPSQLQRGTELVFCWWWTYAWLAELASLPLRAPVVVTGVFDLPTFPQRHAHERLLMALGARQAACNVFVSAYEREGVCALLGLSNADYSPLVVDTSVYDPGARRIREDGDVQITAVFWKRMSNVRRKLIPELVEAMKEVTRDIPNARLTLAGPPEDGEVLLREQVRDSGLDAHVRFEGELSRQQKIELIRSTDLYIQVSRYEGFGLAALEAMACGTPVLVSPVPPVLEVVGDCGSYVEDLTPHGIARGIIDALQNRGALEEKAAAGVSRARTNFSTERRRADLERILRSTS
jgi:glycosyltransferase involved in cell wall biosynthesis